MREGEPLALHGTGRVLDAFLERNALAATLRRTPAQLAVHLLPPGSAVPLRDRRGAPTGLEVTAVPAAGKPPPHLAGRAYHPEDNVGFLVRDAAAGEVLAFFPCVGALTRELAAALEGASAILFDGTFWSEHELARTAPGSPSAREMAHVPVGGPDGSLARLAALRAPRRLFVHVNNTNPMLDERGPERAFVRAAGWEVALDGTEVLP
jgi:pyrroloquinoline quinone biosynthesis protein B